MDIACPHCAATYRVPDTLVDGVNAVRCVACEGVWVPQAARPPEAEAEPAPIQEVAEAPTAATEPPPPEAPAEPPLARPFAQPDETLQLTPTRVGPPDLAPRRLPEAPRRRLARPALPVAWAVSLAVVAAFVIALVVFRAQIAALWPPFGRIAG